MHDVKQNSIVRLFQPTALVSKRCSSESAEQSCDSAAVVETLTHRLSIYAVLLPYRQSIEVNTVLKEQKEVQKKKKNHFSKLRQSLAIEKVEIKHWVHAN